MCASKPTSQAVIFVSNSNAQTEDALRVANTLKSDLRVYLISLNPSAVPSNVLGGLQRNSRIQFVNIATGLPEEINQFWQILALRWRLVHYSRHFGQLALVLGDDICPVERSAIAFAKKRGFSTVLIVDGVLQEAEVEERIQVLNRKQESVKRLVRWILRVTGLLPAPTLYGQAGCDQVAVWGEYSHELMLKRGVPAESAKVTGSPRFDRWLEAAPRQVSSASDGVRRVLFAGILLSAWNIAPFEIDCQVMAALDRLGEVNPNWEITVRPHPSDNPEVYYQIFETMRLTRLKLDRETSVAQALTGCDALVTYDSTTAIEGMILGKPVVCLAVAPQIAKTSYAREGAVLVVENLDHLDDAVRMVLDDPTVNSQLDEARQRFLSRHLRHANGRSADRVARLIESRLGEADRL